MRVVALVQNNDTQVPLTSHFSQQLAYFFLIAILSYFSVNLLQNYSTLLQNKSQKFHKLTQTIWFELFASHLSELGSKCKLCRSGFILSAMQDYSVDTSPLPFFIFLTSVSMSLRNQGPRAPALSGSLQSIYKGAAC